MRIVRAFSVSTLLSVSAASAVFAPATARAQSDPGNAPLRLGPVEFTPHLNVTNIGVDNNVFNEATDPKSDYTFTVAPDLEIAMHPGRLRASYTTRSEFVYFHRYESERSVGRSFTGRAELDLGFLKPFVSIASGLTSARPSSEIDIRARHHPRSYSAGSAIKIASRTSVGVAARRSVENYDEDASFRGVNLSEQLDSTADGYDASFSMDLTPFTTVSFTAGREEQRFEHDPIRNSESLRIGPSVVFSPLGLVTGNASIGYRRFNGRDPSLPDFSGFVANGGVSAQILERYNLSTLFTRDVRYSYEEALPYYLLSAARATLGVRTVGSLELRVTGGRESLNYRALANGEAPGTDRLLVYGGGVGHRLGDRVRVVVDAEFTKRLSALDAEREYRNHRIMASVSWGATNR